MSLRKKAGTPKTAKEGSAVGRWDAPALFGGIAMGSGTDSAIESVIGAQAQIASLVFWAPLSPQYWIQCGIGVVLYT